MTLTAPTVEEFDAISELFEVLAKWANEFGSAGVLPWSAQWQVLGENPSWTVRLLTQNDNALRFQAAFEERVYLDLQSGAENTKVWHSVETRFDMGSLTMTVTTTTEGLQREDFFENGKRVAIRYSDTIGIRPWLDVTNIFDDDGDRVEKVTNMDDGRQRQDIFDNGLRKTTVFTDFSENNDFDWDVITSEYNASGQRTSKTTIYDDGSERIETFVGGIRTEVARTDGGEEAWDTILTNYTPFGDLEARTITYDDGTERLERYFDDALVEVIQSDLENEYGWFTIDRSYDASGRVSRSQSIFDDGDITIMLYIDGLRDTRIELDADGDEDWMYRVTHYDEEGVQAVEIYLEGDEFDFAEATGAGAPPTDEIPDMGPPPPFLPDMVETELLF